MSLKFKLMTKFPYKFALVRRILLFLYRCQGLVWYVGLDWMKLDKIEFDWITFDYI